MLRRQHRPTVQVPFFALGRANKKTCEKLLRLETKKRGCELLLLRCMGDFRSCKAWRLSVRHGITGRVARCALLTQGSIAARRDYGLAETSTILRHQFKQYLRGLEGWTRTRLVSLLPGKKYRDSTGPKATLPVPWTLILSSNSSSGKGLVLPATAKHPRIWCLICMWWRGQNPQANSPEGFILARILIADDREPMRGASRPSSRLIPNGQFAERPGTRTRRLRKLRNFTPIS